MEEAGEGKPEAESWQSLYVREVEQLLYEMSSIPAVSISGLNSSIFYFHKWGDGILRLIIWSFKKYFILIQEEGFGTHFSCNKHERTDFE